MRERPILFSAPMVRAILDGSKTQTRRVMKPQPWARPEPEDGLWRLYAGDEGMEPFPCRYGQVGDRLWVRESILMPRAITERLLRDGADTWPRCVYCADGSWHGKAEPMMSVKDAAWEVGDWKSRGWRGRSSIHMPRWACRIELEITEVRVQRLQDIDGPDAWAEGIPHSPEVNPVHEFEDLWQSINGAGSWALNPWVWVIGLRRLP